MKAFVFPGQGSQAVGMGKALADAFPVAREVFQEVDEALSQKLSALMWEGPADALQLTENTQPALMAVSMAVIRVLSSEGGLVLGRDARFVAGHSLGEYSALAAAGSLSITEAAKLLKLRGQAMQAAVPVGVGSMAALLGLNFAQATEVAKEAAQNQVCTAANDNADGQVVVSGHAEAIDRAIAIAQTKGAKRAVKLPVSAPFHCPLMQPAAEAMQKALESAKLLAPTVPLVANVTALPTSDPATIRRQLVEQVCGTVRWRESVLYMAQNGVTELVECGAGKVLAGLTKRITPDLTTQSLETPEQIEAFLKA
jgi:[acyl-carrier-protein] S-malonyltransferase